MNEIKLNRSNKRSVVFNGTEIAACSTKVAGSSRWSKAAVFETDGGLFVVGYARITCHLGEKDHYDAESFESKEGAVSFLEYKDPETAEFIAKQLGVSERIK